MNTSATGEVRFGRVAPTIPVTDLPRALAFYVGVLQMEKVFENGEPVGFVILKRDQAEFHLTLSKTHKASICSTLHLIVSDATALHDHCVASGVKIIKGLRDECYGLRDFVIADPDGNRLDIGQPL